MHLEEKNRAQNIGRDSLKHDLLPVIERYEINRWSVFYSFTFLKPLLLYFLQITSYSALVVKYYYIKWPEGVTGRHFFSGDRFLSLCPHHGQGKIASIPLVEWWCVFYPTSQIQLCFSISFNIYGAIFAKGPLCYFSTHTFFRKKMKFKKIKIRQLWSFNGQRLPTYLSYGSITSESLVLNSLVGVFSP